MSHQVTTSRLANVIARSIRRAFDQFQDKFREITRRAGRRFAQRDWRGMQADSGERLEIYTASVDHIAARVHELLENRIRDRLVWVSIKAVYSGLINERDDWELAETFFNSVTRRIFTTVGVDEEIEFVHTDYESPPTSSRQSIDHTFWASGNLSEQIRQVIAAYDVPLRVEYVKRESLIIAAAIQSHLQSRGQTNQIERIEMAKAVFYRGEYAYLIGRIRLATCLMPLVFCLRHTSQGVFVDAVLLEPSDVSLLFSFARSYFHVEVDRPYDLVRFIKSIIPRKPTAEIYISIGYNRHGKTELYRHALRHLAGSRDEYQLARGQRGMVMVVFTMPSYPVVFKIIKDHFDYPKQTTRQSVIDRYRLVFNHDRAGRLIDAQEYQYLELDRRRFQDELLEELLAVAGTSVAVSRDKVVIKHCYAERRVTPLRVYLQEADQEAARAAVLDYGQSIKDLALTNIFPGDLMLKNFGVTRQKRVVFYDYDEVCLLTDCTIRQLPESDDYDEMMAAEPWYAVGEHDVFPEEFGYFLGLPPALKSHFLQSHGDLLTVDYWLGLQRRLLAGELFHVAPYAEEKQLVRPGRAPSPTTPRESSGVCEIGAE